MCDIVIWINTIISYFILYIKLKKKKNNKCKKKRRYDGSNFNKQYHIFLHIFCLIEI